MNTPQEPVVLVIGAGGGLGSAIAQSIAHTWADRGVRLVLVGRSRAALEATGQAIQSAFPGSSPPLIIPADVTDPASLYSLHTMITGDDGRIDIVINAVGADVRKPLLAHDSADIRRVIDVNVYGAIHVTRAFLPPMLERHSGTIVHLGGFADGRLAFPYYSVDAASRAAVRTFLESVQREIDGSGVTLTYFSPAPADTDAERPYHPIWREMGSEIVSPEAVAAALVGAITRGKRVHIMGITTRLFATINAVSPRLADLLLMRRYGGILKRYLGV